MTNMVILDKVLVEYEGKLVFTLFIKGDKKYFKMKVKLEDFTDPVEITEEDFDFEENFLSLIETLAMFNK